MPNYDSMTMKELREYLQQRRPELDIDNLSRDEFEKVFVAVVREDQDAEIEKARLAQEAEEARIAEEARAAKEAEDARQAQEAQQEQNAREKSLKNILAWLNTKDKDVSKLQKIVFEENKMIDDMKFDTSLTSSLIEYFTRDNDHNGLSVALRKKREGGSSSARDGENSMLYENALRLLKKAKGNDALNIPSEVISNVLSAGHEFSPALEEVCGNLNEMLKDLPKYFELKYPDGQRFYNPKTYDSQTATFIDNSLRYFCGITNNSVKKVSIYKKNKDGEVQKEKEGKRPYSLILPLVATCILARTLSNGFDNKRINNALEELENFIEPYIAATIDQKSIGFARTHSSDMPKLQDPAMLPSIVYDSVLMIDRMLWLAYETTYDMEGLKETIKQGGKLSRRMEAGQFLHDIALIQKFKPVLKQNSDIPSDIDQGAISPLSYIHYGGVVVPVFGAKDMSDEEFHERLTDEKSLLAAFATGEPANIRAALKVKQDRVADKYKTRAQNPENILKVAVYALMATEKTGLAKNNIDFAEKLVEGYADVIVECEAALGAERFKEVLENEIDRNNAMFVNMNFAKRRYLPEHQEISETTEENSVPEATETSEEPAETPEIEKQPNAYVGDDEAVVKKPEEGGNVVVFGPTNVKPKIKSEDDISLAYRNGTKKSAGCWFTFVDSVSQIANQMLDPDDDHTPETKAHTSKLSQILSDRDVTKRRKMIFNMLETGSLNEDRFAPTYKKFEKDCPVAVRVLEEVIKRSKETQATLVSGKQIPEITVPEDDEMFKTQKNARNKTIRELEKEALELAQKEGKELAERAVIGEFGILGKKTRKKSQDQQTQGTPTQSTSNDTEAE